MRRGFWSCGLGAQRLQALDLDDRLAENLPELPRRLAGDGFERRRRAAFAGWQTPKFPLQAGDRVIGNAAGNDQSKVIEVGGDIEGEAVRGDAARHMNADGGDLAFRFAVTFCTKSGAAAGTAGRMSNSDVTALGTFTSCKWSSAASTAAKFFFTMLSPRFP